MLLSPRLSSFAYIEFNDEQAAKKCYQSAKGGIEGDDTTFYVDFARERSNDRSGGGKLRYDIVAYRTVLLRHSLMFKARLDFYLLFCSRFVLSMFTEAIFTLQYVTM